MYMGGKSRVSKQIAEFLRSVRVDGQKYIEPFVGGASVLVNMNGERMASDLCKPLISLYKSVQNGWVPPEAVSKETWEQYKENREIYDPMTAFCGFGCSFGGAYFSSYVPVGAKNHAKITSRWLNKHRENLSTVDFSCCSYLDLNPENCLVYCDPPYKGTRRYIAVEKFDSDLFWKTMNKWSMNNTVVVSEFSAPDGWKAVKEFESRQTIQHAKRGDITTKEKLFMRKIS